MYFNTHGMVYIKFRMFWMVLLILFHYDCVYERKIKRKKSFSFIKLNLFIIGDKI